MSRLIYADDLPVSSVDFTDVGYYIKKYGTGIPVVYMEDINDAPTIDAVPVIRCKDCKHWEKTWTNDWAKDYHYCIMVDGVRKADFYCADAERRNE